jgi:putative holliday junction resolvase
VTLPPDPLPPHPHGGRQAWVPGVRIGVDVGTVRVGVAVSDPDGLLASPLATLARDTDGQADIIELGRLSTEREAVEIVVGLPRSLSGAEGPAARAALQYAGMLADRVHPIPVRMSDERLTTVAAERRLREAGIRGRKGRSVVDRSAAVLILQGWLDGARRAR